MLPSGAQKPCRITNSLFKALFPSLVCDTAFHLKTRICTNTQLLYNRPKGEDIQS